MNKLRKYSLLAFVLIVHLKLFSQSAGVVFEEHFDNNENGWRLSISPTDQAAIANGKLTWQHNDVNGASLSNYINLVNSSMDYSMEAKFTVKKLGSEYGIMFGGSDQDNAVFLIVKNMQYKIVEFRKGKSKVLKPFTNSLKLKPDNNILKIERKGNSLLFYSNDHLLAELSYTDIMGKAFGVGLWGASLVEVDDFIVKGNKLKINLAENLHYNSPPENLGQGVNTIYGELTPVVSADGRGLYFTRNYSPENKGGVTDYQDIYYSSYENGKWSKALNVGVPVNNDGPNAVNAVSPDGNTILLMNTYDSKGAAQGMGISWSHKTASGWMVPQRLNVRNYYNKSTFNEYFLSGDSKVLLLALQRDDSYGTRDIYVSFWETEGYWSTPKNIGNVVNTPGTELSPFLAADGVTLYFSSTGHPGYGKNDVFMIRRLDDSWTNWTVPQNVGMPVNSKGTDAYYSVPASGEFAFFISEDKSFGKTDIFRIKLPAAVKPKPTLLIYGKVLNSKTGKPIEAGITYRDLESDKESGIARSNPSDGSYRIVLPYNNDYSFFAEKSGYYSVRDSISVPDIKEYKEIQRDIYLTPLEIGQEIPLKNVFFVKSESRLLSSSYPELNRLAAILIDNPSTEIEISGHTDNVGDPEKNILLSEQRVEAVKKYLFEKGVESGRISGKGYGGSKPIADNSNEATRKLNRRVEFKIIKF